MATRRTASDRSSPSGPAANRKGIVEAFDAASCTSQAVTIQSVTIPELKIGDIVLLTPKAAIAGVAIAPGYCLANGTASVPFANPTGAAVDPASQNYDYVIIKK